jgi:hypothetical protein
MAMRRREDANMAIKCSLEIQEEVFLNLKKGKKLYASVLFIKWHLFNTAEAEVVRHIGGRPTRF